MHKSKAGHGEGPMANYPLFFFRDSELQYSAGRNLKVMTFENLRSL